MGEPGKTLIARDQKLSTPNLAVRTVPRSIPRHAQHLAVEPLFRHAGRDVGMMVLHRDQWHRQSGRQFMREDRGTIVWMQIAGNDLRGDVEQPLQILDGLPETGEGFHGREITDVLTEHDTIT